MNSLVLALWRRFADTALILQPLRYRGTKMFKSTVYVKISKNQITLKHIESGNTYEVQPVVPFTTTRLLVGTFSAGEACLKEALGIVVKGGILKITPTVIIHPLEMVEGGLCEVEDRLFRELAVGAGARKVHIHIGNELSDDEVVAICAGD